MRKRVVGIVVAAVLAVVGVLIIVSYTDDADERSRAGQEVAEILVADAFVPAGTPVGQLGAAVSARTVPFDLVVEGAITDLGQVEGLVVSSDLQPNQQLSANAFGEEGSVRAGDVEIPDGFTETSFLVTPDRSIGGTVRAGDTVSIIVAFDGGEQPANSVSLLLDNVLVTAVQGDQALVEASQGDDGLTDSGPSDGVDTPITSSSLVTVALGDADASRLVYAIEYGRLYLSLESGEDSSVLAKVITAENVLQGS